MQWLIDNWAPLWAVVTTLAMLVLALMSKTYASRDDVQALTGRVDRVEEKLDGLPTKTDLHQLALEMAGLRSELSLVIPKLDGVQRISDLLLENELQERKPK
jgi:membrane protein insertase Oxa1/YidC/SpoIIIJ